MSAWIRKKSRRKLGKFLIEIGPKNEQNNNSVARFERRSKSLPRSAIKKIGKGTQNSAITEEIDCTLNIRTHPPEICISKRRHPGKNFIKNDALSLKVYECFVKILFLYLVWYLKYDLLLAKVYRFSI